VFVWMDARCKELLRIAERIEELSRSISVDKSQQAGEGGQWVELPGEEDEPFDSENYYIRRFALKVVGKYIRALEADKPVISGVLRLQKDFNQRHTVYRANGVDFRTKFLKYLRLCGGDRCLRAVGEVFDIWAQNFESGEAVDSAPDSIDEVTAFYSSDDDKE
jgi:hypothetical protein